MNIAVIVLDTLRKDRISPYNREVEFTPNLQAFSEDAEKYHNAYSQAPWSFPSQTSLLTGLYPWQHGATQKQPFVNEDTGLLQEKLGEEGYRTGAMHNNTWMIPLTGVMEGFEETETISDISHHFQGIWRNTQKSGLLKALRKRLFLHVSLLNTLKMERNITDLQKQIQDTEEFLEKNKDSKFFLYSNLVGSHYPYRPPEEYREKHGVEEDSADLESRPVEYSGEILDEEEEEIRRLYDAEVEYLDHCFGQIIDGMKERGLYEDSLIVVCADHGELLGEEDGFGHHFSVNKNLVNVPLMIKTPENEASEIDEVMEIRQLHNRILDEAGIESSEEKCGEAYGMYDRPVIYGEKNPGYDDSRPMLYRGGKSGEVESKQVDIELLKEKGPAYFFQ